jgi:hypothetical protein
MAADFLSSRAVATLEATIISTVDSHLPHVLVAIIWDYTQPDDFHIWVMSFEFRNEYCRLDAPVGCCWWYISQMKNGIRRIHFGHSGEGHCTMDMPLITLWDFACGEPLAGLSAILPKECDDVAIHLAYIGHLRAALRDSFRSSITAMRPYES